MYERASDRTSATSHTATSSTATSRPGPRRLTAAMAVLLLLMTACSGAAGEGPDVAVSEGEELVRKSDALGSLPPETSDADADRDDDQGDDDEDDEEGRDGASTADGFVPEPVDLPEPPDPDELGAGTLVVGPECGPRDDAEIEHLEDHWLAPHVIEATVVEDQVTDEGTQVPGFVVDAEASATYLDGVVVDGGCIIRFDAPAGCIGAVEITGVTVPEVKIPGATVPDLQIGGTTKTGDVAPSVVEGPVSTEAVRTEQVCRVDKNPDDRRVPAVSRPAISRPAVSRPAASRAAISRGAVNTEGTYIPSVYVPSVYVGSVYIGSVYEGSVYLGSELLPDAPDVEVLSNETDTAYVLDADVLFDFDADQLRPDAEAGLRRVAEELAENHPEGPIAVEGHTDSVGDDAYNQGLSERRAATVRDWLVANAGIPADRLTVTGFGESAPTADNATPEGQQQNRRVVIGASHR